MSELLDTLELLASALVADPLLCLANSTIWLDPLWNSVDDEYDDGDEVGLALSIVRRAFPDIYAGAVERIRSGASEKTTSTASSAVRSTGAAFRSTTSNSWLMGSRWPPAVSTCPTLTCTPLDPICCR